MLALLIFWYFSQWGEVTPNQFDFFRCMSSFELFWELLFMAAVIVIAVVSYIDSKF